MRWMTGSLDVMLGQARDAVGGYESLGSDCAHGRDSSEVNKWSGTWHSDRVGEHCRYSVRVCEYFGVF